MLLSSTWCSIQKCGRGGGGGGGDGIFLSGRGVELPYEIRYDFWLEGGGGVVFFIIFCSSPPTLLNGTALKGSLTEEFWIPTGAC